MRATSLLSDLAFACTRVAPSDVLATLSGAGPAAALRLLRHAYLLTRNGLFDESWYAAAYPAIPARTRLAYFLRQGWREGQSPGPEFDTAYYLQANPDVAALDANPAIHYECHGRREGRVPRLAETSPAITEETIPPPSVEVPPDPFSSTVLAEVARQFLFDPEAAQASIAAISNSLPALQPGDPVGLFVRSDGNIFMSEIAELLTAGFNAAGFHARLYDERQVFNPQDDATGLALRVVIAPHEFFGLAHEGEYLAPSWAEGAVLVNVEQLHTVWFQVGLAALRHAGFIWDINLQSAAALAAAGFPARFLPLGYVPDFARFAGANPLPATPALSTLSPAVKTFMASPARPLDERPIDIFFIGYASPRRTEMLGRMAERLSRWRCHFVMPRIDGPQVRGHNAVLETDAVMGIAQRAKIVLNLHQSDALYFEWHRIVLQGIWQGALVVTEPVAAQPCFSAGRHFLAAPPDELPGLIDWALASETGRRKAESIRRQAYEHLTRDVRLDHGLREMFGWQTQAAEAR